MNTELKKKMMRGFLGFVFALTVLFFCGTDVNFAAKVEGAHITLNTVHDGSCELPDITGLTASTVVTVISDNPAVVGFYYGDKDDIDSIVIKGSEQKLSKGTWIVSELGVLARRAGVATITVSVNTDGIATSTTYDVTVEGVKPSLGKLSQKSVRTCDAASIEISNISDYATITISSNKDKAFQFGDIDEKTGIYKGKITIGKNEKIINRDDFGLIIPKKTGNIKINITIEQDGYTVKKTYQLNVTKYVNPIASFRIAQKDYAKKFDKRADIADGKKRGLTVKECKSTLGGRSYSIKMKKGYKLVKLTYRKYNEWGGVKPHTLKGSTLPKDFWELYIVYQDKKGKKWTNSICYSIDVFY